MCQAPFLCDDDTVTSSSLYRTVESLLEEHPHGVLPLIQAGDPVLRRPTQPYDGELGALLPDFLHALHMTMLDAPGVGVAAPQVGVGVAIAVMRDPGATDPQDTRERQAFPFRVVVNPAYEPLGDERVTYYEGCLSVDGYQAAVARPQSIRFTGSDEHGAGFDEELHGWTARIAQHETDHLSGVLYIDKAEIRSLSTVDNLARLWSDTPEPHAAGLALGFDVEQEF